MNKQAFNTVSHAPPANAVNAAGGKAYSLPANERLAHLAAVGTFGDGFYTGAADQVKQLLEAANQCSPLFVAKCAVYCRQQGKLKDMPVVLLAHLTTRGPVGTELAEQIFETVVNNGKQLRSFVQVIRSGVTGRRSLGSAPKRMIGNWFSNRKVDDIWYQSLGNEPTMADVIRLARPKPSSVNHQALFGHLIGKISEDTALLPNAYYELNRWRQLGGQTPSGVPWEMLVSHASTPQHWKEIARNCTWTQMRMNLNTFARHGVFEDTKLVADMATKLSNTELVKKSSIFPYQLLTTYQNTTDIPAELRNALQAAMETACSNIPALDCQVVVCPDVSGSMQSPVTGNRGSATSNTRCIDVASLVAACLLRKNPNSRVLPFDTSVKSTNDINSFDSIMTNAQKLAQYGGGGTDCSLPLKFLNQHSIKADLVVYASDNESWVQMYQNYRGTGMAEEWKVFKRHNPKAKLVCIDLASNQTVQVPDNKDILNLSGFSDDVFNQLEKFVKNDLTAQNWSAIVESVTI